MTKPAQCFARFAESKNAASTAVRESRKMKVFIAPGSENAAAQGSKSSILRNVKAQFGATVAAKRKVLGAIAFKPLL